MDPESGATVARFKELDTFKDYPVYDSSSDRIGRAGGFYRAEGGPQFLEVTLRGFLGKTSKLVPWGFARVHEERKRIMLSCSREDVEDAPDFDHEILITDEYARRTRAHYGLVEEVVAAEPGAAPDQDLQAPQLTADLEAKVQDISAGSSLPPPAEQPIRPIQDDAAADDGERISVVSPRADVDRLDVGDRSAAEPRKGPSEEFAIEEEEAFRLGSKWLPVWHPEFDVVEVPNHYLVVLDLPGVPPEAIQLDVQEDMLTITGERHGEADGRYHRRERPTGRFIRRFQLPRGVAGDAIEARLSSGLLRLRIPKATEAQRITLRFERTER